MAVSAAVLDVGAAPALLNLGSFTRRWSATTLVAEESSREPGHWSASKCLCIRGVVFPGLERKPNTNRCHSPPVSELRRSVRRKRGDFDASTRLDGEKDRGQLWSDPILSTSPGVCHALQGVTRKKSPGRHSLAVSEQHAEDFAGRRGGGSEPRPGTDLKAEWAWQRPSSPGNCRVTFDTTCVIRKVGHAVRGRFSGLQSPSGPPKAFGSYPSGRP